MTIHIYVTADLSEDLNTQEYVRAQIDKQVILRAKSIITFKRLDMVEKTN
jgi:hypothetical protein